MIRIVTLAFFALTFFVSQAHADIWDGHIKPTLINGFDTKGLLLIGAGGGGVAATQPYYDDEMKNSWGDYQKLNHDQSQVGNYLGTGVPGALIAAAQLAFDTENGWAHTEALLWSFSTTTVLKYANQRERPNSSNRHSMPSGHTSTAFTTATSLAYAYGWKVAVPAYMIATYVALTRISENAHWLSDTVAGATIGIFWGRATSMHHESGSTAMIEPWILDDGLGVRWAMRF